MVVFNGYCRPLKGKVDFEVTEVNAIDTVKGTKWQVKGVYEGYNISVFTSEVKANVLLGQLQNNTLQVFDAEIAYEPPSLVYDSEELIPFPFFAPNVFAAEEEDEEEDDVPSPQNDEDEDEDEDEGEGMGAIYHLLGALSQAMQQNQKAEVCAWDDNTENEHPIIDVLARDNYLNIYIKEEAEGRAGSLSIKEIYDKVRVASLNDLKGVQVLDFITGDKHGYWGSEYDEYEGFYMNISIKGEDDDDDDDDDEIIDITLNELMEGLKGIRGNKRIKVIDNDDEKRGFHFWKIKGISDRPWKEDEDYNCFSIEISDEGKHITWATLKKQIEKLNPEENGEFHVDIYYETDDEFCAIENISDGIITATCRFGEDNESISDFEPVTVKELIEHLEDYDDPDEQEVAVFVNIEDEDGEAIWAGGQLGIEDDEQQIEIQPHDVLTHASESFEAEVDYTKMTVKQLKVELKARGLKLSGKKAVLLERLRLDIVNAGEWENPDKVDYEKDIREQQKADKQAESFEAEEYMSLGEDWWDLFHNEDGSENVKVADIITKKLNEEIEKAFNKVNNGANPQKEAIKVWHKMEDFMDRYADEGATDTEPEVNMVRVINNLFRDKGYSEVKFDRWEAESSMPSDEVLTDAEVPPMLFEQYIPPEVWNHIDDSDKEEYMRTGDEGVLSCPECGFTKADLRNTNGFCFATDASSPVYNEDASCPYSKMFAPLHWLEPKNVYSEGFEDAVIDELYTHTEGLSAESAITLNTPEDFVKTYTTTISKELYGEIGDDLPESVSINYSKDGSKVILGYFDTDKRFIENISGIESGKTMEAEDNDKMCEDGSGGFCEWEFDWGGSGITAECAKCESELDWSWSDDYYGSIKGDCDGGSNCEWEFNWGGSGITAECGVCASEIDLGYYGKSDWGAEEMLRAESDRRKQFYVQALDNIGADFEAEEDDDDELGNLGPFTQDFEALSFSDWAEQEQTSHGKDVEFDEWVDDESVKHGKESFDDWAEHEKQSHEARFGAEERIEHRITQTTGLDWETDFNNMSEEEQKVWVDNADPADPTAVKVDRYGWVCLHCGDAWETQAAALRCAEWDGYVLEGREEWKEEMIEKYGAETVEFHEEELYTQGDEDICINCNGVGGYNVWIGKGSIVCNTCKYELGKQYEIPSDEVERKLFAWDSGTMAVAPTSVKKVQKKENNNLLFGLLALGAGIAVIAPNQIKRFFNK